MTRRELGTLMKTAAEKSWRSHELHLLIKAAAYQVGRKQGLKNLIKSACGILEKSAAFRLNVRAGASGLRSRGSNAFKVMAGTQNYLRNIHANARPAPRVRTRPTAPRRPNRFQRFIGNKADTGRLYGEASGLRGWWNDFRGKNMDNFFNRAEVDGRALTKAEQAQYVNKGRELYAKNTKSLPEVRERDMSTLAGVENGSFTPKTWIQKRQIDNSFAREAARLRGNTARARTQFGAAATPIGLATLGVVLS